MNGRPPVHGMTGTKIWNSWNSMIGRCSNRHPRNKYIERGITVAEEWKDFKQFYVDMSATHIAGLTLERIDNNKGYSKENCRWATMKEQAQNRSNGVRVLIEGKEYSLEELEHKYGVPKRVLWNRIRNLRWSVEKATQTPLLTQAQSGYLGATSFNRSRARTNKQ